MTRIHYLNRAAAAVLATVAMLFAGFSVAHAATTPGLRIALNGNGDVLVRGATVSATSTSGFTAQSAIGQTTLSWLVNASALTNFGKGATMAGSLADIAIGDIVSFRGKMSTTTAGLAVDARAVRDHTHPFVPVKVNERENETDATSTKNSDNEKGDANGLKVSAFVHGLFHLGKDD